MRVASCAVCQNDLTAEHEMEDHPRSKLSGVTKPEPELGPLPLCAGRDGEPQRVQ